MQLTGDEPFWKLFALRKTKVAIIHPSGSFCQIMTSRFPKRYKQRMMRREFSQKVQTTQFSTCQTDLTLINPSARRRMKSVFPYKVQTTQTNISHFQRLVWLPRILDLESRHCLRFLHISLALVLFQRR